MTRKYRRAMRRSVSAVLMPLLRWRFGIMSRVAPSMAERQAARMFLTPRRRATVSPSPEGATRFQLAAMGHTLAAWSLGDGSTVLLVHGWGGRSTDMSELARALAESGYRAVAIDMPAHGASQGRRSSLAEWLRVLPALAAGLGGVHAVVAHSLGAAALPLAIEAGLRVDGAVLLAPPLGPGPFIERLCRAIGLPAARVAGMKRVLEADVGRELAFFDGARAAASLTTPALIRHDPADAEVPWSHGEAIHRAWRGSRLEAARGEGHYRIVRSPETIARTVGFIRALPAVTRGRTRSGVYERR